jgi:hypothetical protein
MRRRVWRTPAEKAAALLVVYGAVLLPDDRTFLESLLGAEAAVKLGATANPQQIFDDLVEALTLFASWVQNKRFTGFGPRRGRFAAECAHSAVGPLDAFNAAESHEKVASKEASHALALTAPRRQDALFAIQSLLPNHDVGARARLTEKTSTGTTRDATITATAEVVREVETVRAKVPATMLDDAGLSPVARRPPPRRARDTATDAPPARPCAATSPRSSDECSSSCASSSRRRDARGGAITPSRRSRQTS